MKQIVNVDINFGIGKNNQLLIHIPDDLKYFKKQTLNKVVVMGKNTFLSLPNQQPLKDRVNIILTSQKDFLVTDAIVVHNLEQLFTILKDYDNDDIYVIGGASIYEQLLPFCDQILITKTYFDFKADRFFVNIDNLEEFEIIDKSDMYEYQGYQYQFLTYQRRKISD